MRWRYWVAFACSAILCTWSQEVCAQPRYEVENYIGTLTLKQGSPDVDVELDITYEVMEGTKSDGFKYVGTYEPVNLRGFDEAGNRISVSLRRYRENQVYWSFPPVSGGRKRVVIQFTLRNVLTGTSTSNTLSAPWIGIFKVPVRYAVYNIVFPTGLAPDIRRMTPGDYSRTSDPEGRVVLRATQSPLTQRELVVQFSPGIVAMAPSNYQATSQVEVDDFGTVLLLSLFGIIIAAIVGMLNYNKRKYGRWLTSGGSSGGGCGGGGCGGGGCGGGCGG